VSCQASSCPFVSTSNVRRRRPFVALRGPSLPLFTLSLFPRATSRCYFIRFPLGRSFAVVQSFHLVLLLRACEAAFGQLIVILTRHSGKSPTVWTFRLFLCRLPPNCLNPAMMRQSDGAANCRSSTPFACAHLRLDKGPYLHHHCIFQFLPHCSQQDILAAMLQQCPCKRLHNCRG
jgi:hypothetical protein